jgi:hypothetical protein
MPHYKDGTLAQVGDSVKGTGYNVKGEIVGKVAAVNPNSESCNIQVLHVLEVDLSRLSSNEYRDGQVALEAQRPGTFVFPGPGGEFKMYRINLEYGETKAFEKVG